MTWISESEPICWHTVTDQCNTPNKAKQLAMGEGLEDSEYIDLRVRKTYGKIVVEDGCYGEGDYMQLCNKDEDGAFQVWEVRDVVLCEELKKYK